MKPPLRIAVLEAGTPRPPIKAKHGGYGQIFTKLLKQATDRLDYPEVDSNELEITCWDSVGNENEYPNIADIDAILITGSRYDGFNTESWTLKLVEYTKMVLVDARVRAIGVCYGHQIIGRALGVPACRSTSGWEVSVVPINLTDLGKFVFRQDTLSIFQMHQDEIRGMPTGAHLLASTEKCENQGMYQKGRLITVQGHPEYTEEIVEYSLHARRDTLAPDIYERMESGD